MRERGGGGDTRGGVIPYSPTSPKQTPLHTPSSPPRPKVHSLECDLSPPKHASLHSPSKPLLSQSSSLLQDGADLPYPSIPPPTSPPDKASRNKMQLIPPPKKTCFHPPSKAHLSQNGLLLQDGIEERNLLDQLVGHHPPQMSVRSFPPNVETSPRRKDQAGRLQNPNHAHEPPPPQPTPDRPPNFQQTQKRIPKPIPKPIPVPISIPPANSRKMYKRSGDKKRRRETKRASKSERTTNRNNTGKKT